VLRLTLRLPKIISPNSTSIAVRWVQFHYTIRFEAVGVQTGYTTAMLCSIIVTNCATIKTYERLQSSIFENIY
jgi:hypothetical protein